MNEANLSELSARIKPWLKNGSINIFGMPFAGKDSRAKELAQLFNGAVIGGGDILRNSPHLAELNEKVKDGSLAPTDEYLEAVLPFFARAEFKGKPLFLSSVGRWHGEEPGVMAATRESGHPIKAVVYIKISEAEMRRRWAASQSLQDRGQRHDDAEHVLEKRIAEFETKTLPVVDFYRQQDLLVEVNGEAGHEFVLLTILKALAERSQETA